MNERSVFLEALEIPEPADRAAFLDRACNGDADLRKGVEDLLAANARSGSFMRGPAGGDGTIDHRPSEGPGSRVGPYKLLQEIGEGGMGTVFMAEQEEPVRRMVAVKIIRAGMDSKGVLARFGAERQALALMDHPNIARVLDAGTTAGGSPYFVMELVKGVPITKFCDENQLSLRERLELFIPVCQAIQHAHMKGIIHRDVKPSNVLVAMYDDKPVPKVIDFGVAKATSQKLTDKTLFTAFGAVVGTLEYMSPEQAKLNQLDIDTRSDVYALGVLLYELLTGSTPLDRARLKSAALDEVLRLIREEEPPKPSTRLSTAATLPQIAAARGSAAAQLGKVVRGELDWIVMKSLEKDRTRRYDTAIGLARDVERYLKDEAVEACPPTLGYRLKKAYRKNRTAVRVASAFACLMAGAVVMGAVLAVRATNAERAAAADRDAAIANAKLAADNEQKAVESAGLARAEEVKVKAGQESLQANQYLWDMQMVPLTFESGTIAGVKSLLDRHVPAPGTTDRRGFEWYHWDRQLNAQVLSERLPDADDDYRNSWAVSEDGTRLARFTPPWRESDPKRPPDTPREDSPVLTVWDTTTRRRLLTHRMPITLPAGQPDTMSPGGTGTGPRFSPDGRRVEVEWSYTTSLGAPPFGAGGVGGGAGIGTPKRSGGENGLRQILDVASGKPLLKLPLRGRASEEGVNFSRDGRHFALVSYPPNAGFRVGPGESRKAIEVWSLESGKSVTGPPASYPYANIAFGPLANEYITANPVEPSAQTERLAAVVGGLALTPHVRISVRELTTGKESRGWLVPGESLGNLTISPDGSMVAATVRGGVVTVWEVATGKRVSSWQATASVSLLTFSPTASRLDVSMTSPNRPAGTGVTYQVIALNPKTGVLYPPMEGMPKAESNTVIELKPSPDGKRVVAFHGNVLQTWNARSGKPHLTFRGHVHPIVACGFTPDSMRVWSVERNGVFKEWDLNPPRPVEIPFLGRHQLFATDFAVSGDGSRFAQLVGTYREEDETTEFAVQMRDTAGKERKLLEPTARGIGPQDFGYSSHGGLLLSGDGRRVVLTRSEDLMFRAGEVRPGEKERQRLPAPDLTVWDSETAKVLFYTPLKGSRLFPADGMSGHVSASSPDGRLVAVATEPAQDGAPVFVRIFDVDTKLERRPVTLAGRSGLYNLTFSPDGGRLAAVTFVIDKAAGRVSTRLVIWDANKGGEPVASEELLSGLRSTQRTRNGMCRARIAWLPDSSRLILTHDSPLVSMFAVHDATTGKAVVPLELPPASYGTFQAVATAIACSPDGKRVAALVTTGGGRTTAPELKVWDAMSGKELLTVRKTTNSTRRFGGGGPPRNGSLLTFSGDGHRLLACEFGEVPTWSEEAGYGTNPAFILTTWDATPVPNREPKK